MMIARWSIDAKFGYKPQVIELMQRWLREIGSQIGWNTSNTRLITGSIGALESTVQSEVQVKDLNELNAAWEKLGTISAHQAWSKEMEPFVVSGTQHWQIFRSIDI